MATYNWNCTFEEVVDLLKAWKKAYDEDDEETMIHIENVLPDNICPII